MAEQIPDGYRRVFIISCPICHFVDTIDVNDPKVALRRAHSRHVNHVSGKPFGCGVKRRKLFTAKALRQE